MQEIIQGDLCALTGSILILLFLGRVVADEQMKKWGWILGLVGFLSYAVITACQVPPRSAENLFALLVCSLVVFGFVLGLSWIILPLVVGIYRTSRKNRPIRREVMPAPARIIPETKVVQPDPQQQEDAEIKAREAAVAQKRREDARASVEIYFQLHQHSLGTRFDKPTLETWMKTYMNDEHDADYVEERAQQVRDLIQAHLQKVEPATSPSPDVLAARAEAEAFYAEHSEVHAVCPPRRFQAEIRVRIPDNATPEAAWKGSRDLMNELLGLAAQGEKNRKPVPVNPPLGNI